MGSTETTDQPTGAEEIVWNLGDLYQGTDAPKFKEDLSTLTEKCAEFRAKWNGKVKDLTNDVLWANFFGFGLVRSTDLVNGH